MTDSYKTAFNVQNGVAIEPDGVKAMAEELQKLKQDYEEQNRRLGELKQDIYEAIGDTNDLLEQTEFYAGGKVAYAIVWNRMNYLDI